MNEPVAYHAYGSQPHASLEDRYKAFMKEVSDWFPLLWDGDQSKIALIKRAASHGLEIEVELVKEDNSVRANVIRDLYDPKAYEPEMVEYKFDKLAEHLQIDKAREYNSTLDYMQKRYGKQVGLFLTNRVAKMIKSRKAECISDFRVCVVGNRESEANFDEIASHGCCGCAEETFVFKHRFLGITLTTTSYKVGFNYGH